MREQAATDQAPEATPSRAPTPAPDGGASLSSRMQSAELGGGYAWFGGGGLDASQAQSAELRGAVYRKASGAAQTDDVAGTYDTATQGGGGEIPYRAEMEEGFGADFSDVRAHLGQADAMGALGAEAATRGDDGHVAFADTAPDKETVAHELAHVEQARHGAGSGGGVAAKSLSESGDAAEREADAAAAVVAGGGRIAPGSLTARGSGIQRREVEVSEGDRTRTEDTERVLDQGNQFEDAGNAWDKMIAWKDGTTITFATRGGTVTRAPTDSDALLFIYEMTPDQRSKVWLGREGVLTHIFDQFTRAQSARVMGLCDFPLRWKITHWFRDITAGAGGGRDTIRSMISNSPLGQRLDAARDEAVTALLLPTFQDDHPENLYGDAIAEQLYPDEWAGILFDLTHPLFASWRNSAEKLDAEARWAYVAADPAANIATLKTQGAMGGRNKWTSLLHWGPRGQALSPTMMTNIDTAALTSGVSVADRSQLFEARWNVPLVEGSSTATTFAAFEAVWKALQRVPLGTVSSDVVTQMELRSSRSGGAYTDLPMGGGFGNIWSGTGGTLTKTGHTVRHEVGHAADVQLGGYANLASKPPILWKKWWTDEPWYKEMLRHMDAPTSGAEGNAFVSLLRAGMNGTAFTNPFAALPSGNALRTVWGDAATAYTDNGNSVIDALTVLKDAGKHTADPATIDTILSDGQGNGTHPSSEPSYVRDHYFLKKYGEHFAYHKSGAQDVWGNSNLRAYTLCSPYEFYADIFSAYFSTDTNRAANVPGWTAGYMATLEERFDQDATQDPNNDRSLAYGNWQAPGAE